MSGSNSVARQLSCPCGRVKMRMSAAPLTSYFCHCSDCRESHGAPYVENALFKIDKVLAKGKLMCYKSTPGVTHRYRCARCYTPIYMLKAGMGLMAVSVTLFDDITDDLRAKMHFYYSERMLSFDDGLPKYRNLPKNLKGDGELMQWNAGGSSPTAAGSSRNQYLPKAVTPKVQQRPLEQGSGLAGAAGAGLGFGGGSATAVESKSMSTPAQNNSVSTPSSRSGGGGGPISSRHTPRPAGVHHERELHTPRARPQEAKVPTTPGGSLNIMGQCKCGNVMMRLTGDPVFAYTCHCTKCQGFHGAPYVDCVVVRSQHFTYGKGMGGAPTTVSYQSSDWAVRHRCNKCFSPVFQTRAGINVVVVYPEQWPEVYDDEANSKSYGSHKWLPRFHGFYKNRCINVNDSLHKYTDMPYRFKGNGIRMLSDGRLKDPAGAVESKQRNQRPVVPDQHARCACGAVTLVLKGGPQVIRRCHCQECRNTHEQSFVELATYPKGMCILLGEDACQADAEYPNRFSCGRCHTQMFLSHKDQAYVSVFPQTFEGENASMFTPNFNSYYGERTADLDDGLIKYRDMPAKFGGSDVVVDVQGGVIEAKQLEDVSHVGERDLGNAQRTGSCHCGNVQVATYGDPLFSFMCHCTDCRGYNGAPRVAHCLFDDHPRRFQVMGDTIAVLSTPGITERHRCANCYSPVFIRKPNLNKVIVPPGMLTPRGQEPEDVLQPKFHIYYNQRVMDQYDLLPKFKNVPKSMGGVANVRLTADGHVRRARSKHTPKHDKSPARAYGPSPKNKAGKVMGQCPCGLVHIGVSNDPIVNVVCHCVDCQSSHAAPRVVQSHFEEKDFGHLGRTVAFESTPGKVWRHRCANCQSPVFTKRPGSIVVFPTLFGAAALSEFFAPMAHQYYAQRQLDVFDDLPKYKDLSSAQGGTGTLLTSGGHVQGLIAERGGAGGLVADTDDEYDAEDVADVEEQQLNALKARLTEMEQALIYKQAVAPHKGPRPKATIRPLGWLLLGIMMVLFASEKADVSEDGTIDLIYPWATATGIGLLFCYYWAWRTSEFVDLWTFGIQGVFWSIYGARGILTEWGKLGFLGSFKDSWQFFWCLEAFILFAIFLTKLKSDLVSSVTFFLWSLTHFLMAAGAKHKDAEVTAGVFALVVGVHLCYLGTAELVNAVYQTDKMPLIKMDFYAAISRAPRA